MFNSKQTDAAVKQRFESLDDAVQWLSDNRSELTLDEWVAFFYHISQAYYLYAETAQSGLGFIDWTEWLSSSFDSAASLVLFKRHEQDGSVHWA